MMQLLLSWIPQCHCILPPASPTPKLFFFPGLDAIQPVPFRILEFHEGPVKMGGINVVSLRGPISFLGSLDEQNMQWNQPTNYMKLQVPHIL